MQNKKSTIKISENDIKKQVRDYLTIKGWFVFPILQGLGTYKGIPDMIAIKDGITIYIECKTEKGIQSKHQKKFQFDIEQHGGVYIIARGIDDLVEKGI